VARPRSIPKLTRHKATGQARVTIDGKDFYLGTFGTPKAEARYHRLIAAWIAAGKNVPAAEDGHPLQTIAEVAAAFLQDAHARYHKRDKKTSTVSHLTAAVRFILETHAAEPVDEFGPLALQAVRDRMIASDPKLARSYINSLVQRIRQMFAWAAERELIDPAIPHRLAVVRGLRRGQGGRETDRIRPVAWSTVALVRSYVSPQVWAMIRLQWHSGMRPGEVVIMRTADIEADSAVWFYRPAVFKTQHHDDRAERIVALGPRAQKILAPWLRKSLEEFLFQPIEAEAARNAERTENRKIELKKRPPAHEPARRRKRRRRRSGKKPGDHYTTDSYRTAITRAIDEVSKRPPDFLSDDEGEALAAWVESIRWTPHRIRHSYATRVRKAFGLDAARAALGHSRPSVTLDYAELDMEKAAAAARSIG